MGVLKIILYLLISSSPYSGTTIIIPSFKLVKTVIMFIFHLSTISAFVKKLECAYLKGKSTNWRSEVHYIYYHSSEIRGLCLMKCPSKMLQNLPYFIYTKIQSCFSHFSFHVTLFFSLMNALVYVNIDQGTH